MFDGMMREKFVKRERDSATGSCSQFLQQSTSAGYQHQTVDQWQPSGIGDQQSSASGFMDQQAPPPPFVTQQYQQPYGLWPASQHSQTGMPKSHVENMIAPLVCKSSSISLIRQALALLLTASVSATGARSCMEAVQWAGVKSSQIEGD